MSRYRQPYTLYKRGDFWYYRTYTPDGIRTSGKTTGCTNKNAARNYCEKLYLAGNLWQSDVKFYDYALHFYDDNSPYVKDRPKPLTANTLKGYRTKMEQNILPYFQRYLLKDINYTVLKKFRTKLAEDYKPSVITGTMSVMKHIMDSAFRDRIITINPFDYLESYNAPSTERDAFTLNEVIHLYNHIGDEFKNTVLLMALTGMRISEAIGVEYNELCNSSEGFKYIKLEKQYNNKTVIPVKMDSRRPVPVIPEIIELFGFDPLRLSAFYRAFQEVKYDFENADERLLCFHSLRHFFITNAKSKNINESKVEYLAGHKAKKVIRTYTNYKAEDLKEILEWQKATYEEIKKGSPIDNR